ncbi:MAG: FAD-dependent oxidoreductase [Planctomycetales bacterium]|nr:FAD-dependent oxidoreductase [Planctomycetales bacterium]
MRIAVIGAGPAGMTAALQLSRRGVDVSVFEAGPSVGGLARSFELWGQRVDLGPHRFFSTDARVNRLWLDIVGREYAMVDRLTRIYYRRRFFQYPLKPLNALWNMGLPDAAMCVISYFNEHLRPESPRTDNASFESWVVRRFGRRLFEMFFKSYSEKLWGIPCHELSADFAAQRIKKLSFSEAARSALSPQRGTRHTSLVDRFAYPLNGTGSVYEKMAERLRDCGGQVHLECPVRRVVHEGFDVRGVELQNGRVKQFDHVISTMPLTNLVRGLNEVPADVRASADDLKFRNTILVYLHVDSDSLFDDQWLYIHAPDLKMGRVTNFRNWVPQLYGEAQTTILAVEYWCDDSDPTWTASDDHLIEQATRELQSTGLLRDQQVMGGHVVRVRRCYPVYRVGYREHTDRLADYLRNFRGLTPIGRYGTFKYNNQDHSILMGILAAENLLDECDHDLWSVNTDHEAYQEAALITETGLVVRRFVRHEASDDQVQLAVRT